MAIRDAAFQVIPTAWVLAAEDRWKPEGAHGLAMTAMALDPAGGERDSAELAGRYGGWYAELICAKGKRRRTAPQRRRPLSAIVARSPGRGDAVVMAWSKGNAAAVSRQAEGKWKRDERQRWIV